MLKPQFNHSNGSSANRAERANVVADRQPDLDNASAGISLHMYFVRVCRPPRTIFGGLFWLTKPLPSSKSCMYTGCDPMSAFQCEKSTVSDDRAISKSGK